jgi:hypothetical protein
MKTKDRRVLMPGAGGVARDALLLFLRQASAELVPVSRERLTPSLCGPRSEGVELAHRLIERATEPIGWWCDVGVRQSSGAGLMFSVLSVECLALVGFRVRPDEL